MNVKEKEILKERVKEILWKYKGNQKDRVFAEDYIDLYKDTFNPILDILIEGLDEVFDIRLKDKGTIRWED